MEDFFVEFEETVLLRGGDGRALYSRQRQLLFCALLKAANIVFRPRLRPAVCLACLSATHPGFRVWDLGPLIAYIITEDVYKLVPCTPVCLVYRAGGVQCSVAGVCTVWLKREIVYVRGREGALAAIFRVVGNIFKES